MNRNPDVIVLAGDTRDSSADCRLTAAVGACDARCACVLRVDDRLRELHTPGMTADTLFTAYAMLDGERFMRPPAAASCDFSAPEYARRRVIEICSAPPHGGES